MTEDIHQVQTKITSCEGNAKEGTGHPLVYLNLEKELRVVCPYCSRLFVYEDHHQAQKLYLSSYPSPYPKGKTPKN